MASTDNNTIWLDVSASSKYYEFIAASTISPGMVLNVTSAGLVEPYASAGERPESLFAGENIYEGKTITDDYVVGDRVMVRCPRRGDKMLAMITYTTVIPQGSPLVAYGGGELTVAGVGEWHIATLAEPILSTPTAALYSVRIM